MTHTFFEGPEKKVELAVRDGFAPLRGLGEERWRAVVSAADAHVISRLSNEQMDAYLLSESSLFVYDSFVTMITCGRTQLVNAVAEMLSFIPPEEVAVLIYERKNEHFPEQQHTSFLEDARRLREWLPGAAVQFGAEHDHAVRLFHTTRAYRPDPNDTTLEVLMHGIEPRRAEAFCAAGSRGSGSDSLAQRVGLDRILDGFRLDEHAFEPAGYSLNAVRDGDYFTIHVTPERVGSYVSFETNVDFRADPSGLVARVIDCFAPESFDVVSFVPAEGPPSEPLAVELPGYLLRKQVQEPLSGYQVSFQHFYRPATTPARAAVVDLG